MPRKHKLNKINKPAKSWFKWQGFNIQKGSIYGSIEYEARPHYFVYMGKKRRAIRPDGSSAGWQIELHLLDIRSNASGDRNPVWYRVWIDVKRGDLSYDILKTNPTVEYQDKTAIYGGHRSTLAYVPKHKDIGFIYSMVRERY